MAEGDSVRLRIDVAYDGASFAGWARQPDQRTVQGVLEEALSRVLRLGVGARVQAAGRTDAGVHACGQVAHMDVPSSAWTEAEGALRRLARVLPRDVRVRAIAPAPSGFDARFSALSRRYVYRVCDDVSGVAPLWRHAVLWHRGPLDHERMHAAAQRLLGEHDFGAFCRKKPGGTTIRRLIEFSWQRVEKQSSSEVAATIEADAFCHSMVRAVVGACLAVGTGRRDVDWPAEVLARGVRDSAVPVVAAHGLCLQWIHYPEPQNMAARARQTRQLRGTPAAPGSASPGAATVGASTDDSTR